MPFYILSLLLGRATIGFQQDSKIDMLRSRILQPILWRQTWKFKYVNYTPIQIFKVQNSVY